MRKHKRPRKFSRKHTRHTTRHESYTTVASTMALGLLPTMIIVFMLFAGLFMMTQVGSLSRGVSISVQVPTVALPSISISLPKFSYQPKSITIPQVQVETPPVIPWTQRVFKTMLQLLQTSIQILSKTIAAIFVWTMRAIMFIVVSIGKLIIALFQFAVRGALAIFSGMVFIIVSIGNAIVFAITTVFQTISLGISVISDKIAAFFRPIVLWIQGRIAFNIAFAHYFAHVMQPFVRFFGKVLNESFLNLGQGFTTLGTVTTQAVSKGT